MTVEWIVLGLVSAVVLRRVKGVAWPLALAAGVGIAFVLLFVYRVLWYVVP